MSLTHLLEDMMSQHYYRQDFVMMMMELIRNHHRKDVFSQLISPASLFRRDTALAMMNNSDGDDGDGDGDGDGMVMMTIIPRCFGSRRY